jgi:hypothetical protein
MNQDKPADGRKAWQTPEIVEVGGVETVTTYDDGNLRDNQGDATPKYKVFTRTKTESPESELPHGD